MTDARPGGPVVKTSAQPGTRISCHAALDEAARAPFSKERRMKFAKATKFHRKSGRAGDQSEDDLSAVGAALNLSAARDAQAHNRIGYAICGVADYIAFGGKVAGDTAHTEGFDGLNVGDDRRCPFAGVAIEQSL